MKRSASVPWVEPYHGHQLCLGRFPSPRLPFRSLSRSVSATSGIAALPPAAMRLPCLAAAGGSGPGGPRLGLFPRPASPLCGPARDRRGASGSRGGMRGAAGLKPGPLGVRVGAASGHVAAARKPDPDDPDAAGPWPAALRGAPLHGA